MQVHRQFSATFGKQGQKAQGCLIATAMMPQMDVGNHISEPFRLKAM